MVRSAEFSAAVRGGRRAGDGVLVVHAGAGESGDPARVGFVVSRAVGNAVVRNRVKRRLRPIVRASLGRLGSGDLVVVRALPASGAAGSGELSASFERCLTRVLATSSAKESP